MRLGFARQEFRGAFADGLVAGAAHESMVVQEEPQEVEVLVPEMPAQEEVVSKAAVEVLYNRTRSWCIGHRIEDCGLDVVKRSSQLPAKLRLAFPVARLLLVQTMQLADRVNEIDGDVEPPGDVGQLPVEDCGEGEDVVALVLERTPDRADAVRA